MGHYPGLRLLYKFIRFGLNIISAVSALEEGAYILFAYIHICSFVPKRFVVTMSTLTESDSYVVYAEFGLLIKIDCTDSYL
jgi:hypothetical protein